MDFVTYKIGKKLQEKGYPHGYNRFGYRPIYSDECTIRYLWDTGAYDKEYYGENIPCPTINEVLDWLRKEKEIFIIVEPFPTTATKNKICWCWHYKWNSDGVYMDSTFPDDLDYMTYEKAAIAGIEYVLDNLI